MNHDCQVIDRSSHGGTVYWLFACVCGARGRLRRDRWRAIRDARRHQDGAA